MRHFGGDLAGNSPELTLNLPANRPGEQSSKGGCLGDMNRLPELPGQEADFRALISELAARIADLEASARKAGDRTPALNFSDEKLGIIAMSMYRARLHRAKFFDYALF